METLFADRIVQTRAVTFDPATGGVQAIRERRLGASTLAAGAMLTAAATSAFAARRVDGPAAGATTPVVAWLAFATVLSEELFRRNR